MDYRPDAPQTNGAITNLLALIPDKSGQYRTPYMASGISSWPTALHATVTGCRMVEKLDGTPLIFFGSTRLEEWNLVTLSNVSKGGGSPYTAGSKWWFCQFGDTTVASNYTEATQARSGAVASAFADLSGAPKAKVFVSQRGYLLAFNYDDGTAFPAGVKWADEESSTAWTPTNSNTAGNAALIETPGEIVAAAEIHDIVVAWKHGSMYVGGIVGGTGTDVWRFNVLSKTIGIASQEAWVSTPVGIIFVSPYSGIFKFDGSIPTPIDEGIRQTIYRNMGTLSNVWCTHDAASANVHIWVDNGTNRFSYVYNYETDRWGTSFSSAMGQAAGHFTAGVRDCRYDDFVSLSGTANVNRRCHLVIDHLGPKVFNLDTFAAGSNTASSQVTVATVRDPKAGPRDQTQLQRVNPLWGWDTESAAYVEPVVASLVVTPRTRMAGGALTALPNVVMDAAKGFDMNATANSFQLDFVLVGEAYVLGDIAYKTNNACSL